MSDYERPLLPGDEVWFEMHVYHASRPPARTVWQQSRVNMVDYKRGTIEVRYHDRPFNEVRKVLKLNEVHRVCPGEPLFSC